MSARLTSEARVLAEVERLAPQYEAWLQELVRTPSPSGEEGAAQALVRRRMEEIGLAVDSFEVDPDALGALPAFNRSPRSYAGRPCVVGRLAGQGGRSLLLNAHIDTVPVDAGAAWTRPPYAGEIAGGRLYGRGACDDKAGVAECLLVAHALRDAGVNLAGDLVLASVIEDESTGNGTLACVARGYTADGVIIVDGTWPERLIVSHLGQVSFRIRLAGVAGHATSAGPNPAHAIGHVIDALQTMVAGRNAAQPAPWGTKAGPYFVNIGMVRAGVWPGSVPADAIIEGQFGFPPPDTPATGREHLRTALSALATADWPLSQPPAVEFVGLEAPVEVGDAGNPLASMLAGMISRRHGAQLRESVILGHCDLRHYTSGPHATASACLYGPGGGGNVHGTDEYFELSHLRLIAGNLACVALEWCGVADGA